MSLGDYKIESWDWKKPAYDAIYEERIKRLTYLREHTELIPRLWEHYAQHPADFIHSWGCTFDPRLAERGLRTVVPFVLFPRQSEFIAWLLERWQAREDGLVEKSRDMGVSWLTVGFAAWMMIFRPGTVIAFGSRKETYVDEIGNPASLFWKVRQFIDLLPQEFQPHGWDSKLHAPFMKVQNLSNGSFIVGEAGANIGRGNRTSIYFVDEAAFLEHPDQAEAALSQTCNCRVYVSTPNGAGNPFYRKAHDGKTKKFIFDWRAQPLDAKLLTPTGWRTMGEIKVGDLVIGRAGVAVKVLGVFPQGSKEVYRVTFCDGSSTECCGDHLWSVIPYGNQRAERKHILHTMPLREIAEGYVTEDSRGFKKHLYQVPLVEPIIGFDSVDLPLHPYVLGCLLGDGSIASNSPICAAIRDLGLLGTASHTKFIPEIYMLSSVESRLDLLRGIMDTDGHAPKNHAGAARLSTTSRQLADDVAFVSRTLGGTANITLLKPQRTGTFPGGRICNRRDVAFLVTVKLPAGMVPFRLSRKVEAFKPATRRPPRRSIAAIDMVGIKECQCIKVDSEDGLYVTDDLIVTHNSDPRKGEAWYEEQKQKLDPAVLAQEVDRSYSASVENSYIPDAVAKACSRRGPADVVAMGPIMIGIDVARFGNDKTVFTARQGRLLLRQEVHRHQDLVNVAGLAKQFIQGYQAITEVAQIAVDTVGLGAGVADMLRRDFGDLVVDVESGIRLADGQNYNLRARMWRDMREWLKAGASIPNDPDLITDLTALRYGFRAGELLIESKDDAKKRGIKSPDRGDSLALTLALPAKQRDEFAAMASAPHLGWEVLDSIVGY